ncbi:MAG: response regulator transcription factor [Thermodesulfovibrionia bacterium]|nr:response regulator transcription factor [Thermodesulfovibrionia bacterium]MCK5511759.1 response regulator transcription factor [Thermodesulfovibrionia bacterium]
MKGSRILVVEDEEKIAEIVKAYLKKEGFQVVVAETGEKALSVLKDGFDVVILDLMLPDIAGEDICQTIRKDSDIPVIMLTAKSEEEDRIKGLGIGADDYVVKPFSPRELVARVKALLRRVKGPGENLIFNKGDLVIDPSRFEITKNSSPLVLTPTEFKLLHCIAQRPGQVFTRLQLVNVILGYDFEGYDRTIDAHIKNIRHKIEDDPRSPAYIKTVYGIGYKFIGQPHED